MARAASTGLLLALDAGNTTVGVGVFRGPELVFSDRVSHRGGSDPAAAVATRVADYSGWTGAVLSSVVPSLDAALLRACRNVTGTDPMQVNHESDLGISLAVPHPEQAGVDRLVNAAAAFHLYGGPLLVVDVGTAITVSAVTADGRYLGGAIAPGPETALHALVGRAEKLFEVPLEAPPDAIGATTEEAMRSGLVFGFAGLVDRLASDAAARLGGKVGVWVTGGLAAVLAPHLRIAHRLVPDLTLNGLRLLYERTRKVR